MRTNATERYMSKSNAGRCVAAGIFAALAFGYGVLAISSAHADKPTKLKQPLQAGFDAPKPEETARISPAASSARRFACPRLISQDGTRPAVVQGVDGWFFRAGDLAEDLTISPAIMADFARLSKVLAEKGTSLILAPTPPRGQIGRGSLGPINADTEFDPGAADQSDRQFREEAAKAGLAIVPALPPTVPGDFFFRRDHHWTPEGARIFAENIAAFLATLPQARALPRLAFKTTTGETIDLPSHLNDQIAPFCDEALGAEKVTLSRTELSAETADDLFGDAAAPTEQAGSDALFGGGDAPSIALIGTSFSEVERYGFEGALLQATGLQVANHAISSGGAFASMIAYLSGPGWRDTPSPILLWEFQRNPALSKDATLGFRQAIAAARGDCGPAAAASLKGLVEQGAALSLPVPGSLKLAGPDAYVVLRFADPLVRSVTLSFQYEDGQIEDVPLVRHPRLQGLDTFYLELTRDIPAALSSLTISPDFDKPVETELRLCGHAATTP